nr:hypothetical protein [Tanacetum cinerariifolium]
MVLQLTDITSEIMDEELLEFTSEYYIPFALHPVVPAANTKMDLFSVVHLSKPKLVTKGVRPLRDGEEPLLEATTGRTIELVLEQSEDENTAVLEPTPLRSVLDANVDPLERNVTCADYSEAAGITRAESETEATIGRTMELVLEQPEDENTAVLEPIPLRSVPDANVDPLERNVTCADYSEAAGITRAESETEEVNSGLKRKRATSGDGAGSSKRVRHVILGDSASTEGEAMDASPTTAAKDVTETPPPMAQLKARFSGECSRSVQKDEEIALLKAQLADADVVKCALVRGSAEAVEELHENKLLTVPAAQLADVRVEAESVKSYAHKLAEEKMSLLVQLDQERASSVDHRASCHWVVKYLEGAKNNHFAGLEEFRQGVEGRLEKQEEKLRKLSIEYDEELYPHLVSSIAERRWLISHGLNLAAMCTLESQEVKQSFGDVVKCALARGRAEAIEEPHENKLLTVPATQVPGYNKDTYEELVAAMEKMKLFELPHIVQLERDQDYPIDVIMVGLTLARHDTEGAKAQSDFFLKPDEIPLKESLKAHSMRLAKKKGVKGKAILCGVGAAHLPRSDRVPVSVATMSPRDSDLLEKLVEARNAAYQVNSSE